MCSYEDISQQSFELALNLATQKLSSMKVGEICRKSGASRIDDNTVLIQYLNRPYRVALSTGEVSLKDGDEDVSIKDQILILHYLSQAMGAPFTNKLIAYTQLQGGKFYCPAFQKRTLEPVLKCFGNQPDKLLDVAETLGGKKATHGDVSVYFDAFPSVRIVIVLWRGDDEVPSGGNILFDQNIKDYLSTEDVVVLTEVLIWKLINLTKSHSS
jgi:hypothetical protein